MKVVMLFLLVLTAFPCMAGEQSRRPMGATPPDIAAFVQRLDTLRKSADIPGLSVAVVKDREIVLALGLGYADLEQRIPATAETPYNIASVAKPLSAVVALRLVELKVLDLDRPMADYSEWAEFCTEFSQQPSIFASELRCQPTVHTLRHLLSHTATGTPGSRFSYNPVLYFWASRPIAAAGGAPFSALVEQYVFKPAGMGQSGPAAACGFGRAAGPAASNWRVRVTRTCREAAAARGRRRGWCHHVGPRPCQVRCRAGSGNADIGGVAGRHDGSDAIEQW